MKLTDTKAIALLDCNNFYVSAESIFNPKLRHKPIVVLSNNDGCVVSRSPEAREFIPMGAPFFEVEDALAEAGGEALSSNYELYGDMSRRIMNTLHTYSPEIEVYSVDEAFLGLGESKKGFDYLGREIREKIDKYFGVPVGVGIAETKTLAKIANRIAKKSDKAKGVVDLYKSPYTDVALERTKINDVWEVGKATVERVAPLGVRTALDFKNLDLRWVKKNLTVKGGRTLLELRGFRCFPLELEPPPKKNTCSSGSFSRTVNGYAELFNAVSYHLDTAVARIRKYRLAARAVTVFIQTNRFQNADYNSSFTYKSHYPSDNLFELQEWARICFDRIFEKNLQYKKAGVVLEGLMPTEGVTKRLYDSNPQKEKLDRLNRAMDEINGKFGRGTVHLATVKVGKWKMRRELMSPRYTTRIDEVVRLR
jgi:DNA polymerase V